MQDTIWNNTEKPINNEVTEELEKEKADCRENKEERLMRDDVKQEVVEGIKKEANWKMMKMREDNEPKAIKDSGKDNDEKYIEETYHDELEHVLVTDVVYKEVGKDIESRGDKSVEAGNDCMIMKKREDDGHKENTKT